MALAATAHAVALTSRVPELVPFPIARIAFEGLKCMYPSNREPRPTKPIPVDITERFVVR